MSALELPDKCYLRCYPLPEVMPPTGLKPGLGGMYAAAKDGLGQPITAAPQTPEFFDAEGWRFGTPNDSGNIQIIFVPSGPQASIVLPTSGWTNSSETHGTPIILTDTPSYYQCQEIGRTEDGSLIYTIRPVGHLVGMDFYVGVNEKTQQLEIVAFPVGGTQEGRPGWIVY
ncbi:hypothetical protein FRC12_008383 [Ceratobasidium sp. 428]|nr:hypothetical protein FRC12_008383 [Ceratobasidium sp. 428]